MREGLRKWPVYIGDNSKLFLEPTELMRRIQRRRKARVANSVHACRTARGSIAPHVRCLDPGSLLGFQLRVTSAEFFTLSAMGVPHGSL